MLSTSGLLSGLCKPFHLLLLTFFGDHKQTTLSQTVSDLPFVESRRMAPKDIHILVPETCEYFILCGKRDLAGILKLRLLRGAYDPGLYEWVLCNHKGSCKRETGWSEPERVAVEAEVRITGCEDSTCPCRYWRWRKGTTSWRTQVAFRCWKRQGNGSFPGASRRKIILLTLTLAQWNPVQILTFTITQQTCGFLNIF